MKPTHLLLAILIFAVGEGHIQAAVPTSAELARLRISIPGLGSSSYPLIMAQKKGYFRAEGYDVELIPMAAGLAVKTLLAGEVGATAAGTVLANLQGAKVRLVMGFIRELPYDLVVVPEIKRIEDLRGKKVAVADRGSVTFFVVRAILQAHGMEPDRDVTLLNMGTPAVRHQALMTGVVHGVVANFDGTAFLADRGYHSVAKAGKFMKGFAGSLSVTEDQLMKRPDEVLRMVRATLKGIRAYLAHREEAIKHSSAWTKISPANAAKVHELMSAGALAPDGLLDRETMESVIQESREVAGVKRAVKTEEVFDFRLVQRANEEIQGWRP
ncbi:MAG: glycine betaine transporter substrate-binding protein [Deltaproteobacteria bacterium]|nr:glycine betaine transporter substrate-binding protein [Deltaproteobacteria bacterium]